MIWIETKSARETQRVAALLVGELRRCHLHKAMVIALTGELGAGKTTFVQGFAQALGVKENVLSPTFVLMKIYPLARKRFRRLAHIDCYRLASPNDLSHLGFKQILKDKDAIVLIEWAERVKKLVPRGAIWIRFRHSGHPHKRVIEYL